MITKHLKKLLLNHDELKKFVGIMTSSEKQPGRIFSQMAVIISTSVEKKIRDEPDLAKFVRYSKDQKNPTDIAKIIGGRTLSRMFSNEEDDASGDNGNRDKSINALLIFLEIPQDNWPIYKDHTEDFRFEQNYLGYFYLYRYHYTNNPDKIVRTLVRLSHKQGNTMHVEYHSLSNVIETGYAVFKEKVLTIIINSGEKTIEITAGIVENKIKANNVLNAIIRSSRLNRPYTKYSIMLFAENQELDIKEDKIRTVYHSTVDEKEITEEYSEQDVAIDPIVEFLARKKKELFALPFERPTLKGIDNRNKEAFSIERPFYSFIADTLKGHWYSISSYQPTDKRIYITSYNFIPSAERQECTFTSKRYENGLTEISGYVEYFHTQLVFKMSRKDMKKYKDNRMLFYSAGKYNVDTDNIHASTTLLNVTHNSNLNAKEIFFKADAPIPGIENGISYDDFIDKFDFISSLEKHILLNGNYNTFPNVDYDAIEEFSEFEKFSGKYLAYIPGEEDESLLQLTIEIDKLGKTTEVISYQEPFTGKPIKSIYIGFASKYKDSLRLSNQTKSGQRSDYLFTLSMVGVAYVSHLKGLTLDLDMYKLPAADQVIAIRFEELQKLKPDDLKFSSDTIKKGSSVYNAVDVFLKEKLDSSINKYFFIDYPSIREKRK